MQKDGQGDRYAMRRRRSFVASRLEGCTVFRGISRRSVGYARSTHRKRQFVNTFPSPKSPSYLPALSSGIASETALNISVASMTDVMMP